VKAKRRIIVIAAALVAAVFALALVASSWVDGSQSGAAASGSATIPQPSSALLVGRYGGQPWRAETTLLPNTRTVERHGQRIETLQSQFVANLNGRVYAYNEVNNALDSINRAVRARRARQGSVAALDAAQASLDLQLRHRPKVEANVSRFGLWARQLQVDAAAGESGAVTSDLAILGRVRDRIPQPTS
jgi:hypothetical protein